MRTPLLLLLLLQLSLLQLAQSLPLYGCNISDDLCDENEICFADNLFGQCYAPDGTLAPPTVLSELNEVQLELLKLELTRLAEQGNDWSDTQSQCVLAYFKLSIAYDLQYDPDFCQARDPTNIWALIQLIEMGLKEEPQLVDNNPDEQPVAIPVLVEERDDEEGPTAVEEAALIVPGDLSDLEVAEIVSDLNRPFPLIDEEAISTLSLPDLSDADAQVVGEYLQDIVNQKRPDLSQLSDDQLNVLIASILELKAEYEAKEDAVAAEDEEAAQDDGESVAAPGEIEEPVAVDERSQQYVLKKDVEKVGDVRTGLNPDVHNIVKGRRSNISRVVGNRVYLKVNIKEEEQLLPLIEFLQNTIALPNNLIFDDFNFDDGQLSLRISRAPAEFIDEEKESRPKDKRINSVEGVAQAVYKRRKDIAQLSGAEVAETGIGIGEDSVPVANNDQEWFVVPLLFVSIFTITSLTGVLAVHLYKRRRGNYAANIRQLSDAVDGKSDSAYQELCRQRMSSDAAATAAGQSKSSSTSSWVEDEKGAIDISTGHVLLNFLQSSLSEPAKIDAQWEAIKDYRDESKTTTTAVKNGSGNRAVVPYDETLVPITTDEQSTSAEEYLNASFVYDDDPRQAAFIACQSPLATQYAAFWRAVWQQGVNLIVNLSTLEESRKDPYWPERGSECHAEFEIHLVSEHIWSDDYLVRSFYLKNLKDGQTRTITQFHFVSWRQNEAPATPKSLLEFRRKVNKSYRGRCSPLLVHSTEGAGRAGVYCAVDLICQRIQRGVKEMDVAASVEHLRDHRPSMVKTVDQYKFIYAAVAHEVSAVLKGLQQ